MRVRSVWYYIAEAGKGIFRNKLMSVSSMLTVAACLFIVILFYCIAVNIDSTLSAIESDVELSAFIEDDSAEKIVDINELYRKIVDIDHVLSAVYVTREEHLERFVTQLGNSELFDGYGDYNPLRNSFTIMVDDPANTSKVVESLRSWELKEAGIASVNTKAEVIDFVSSIGNAVRIISLIIILALGILSVVIITNTIKLTINSRKTEIGIMKYIGATNWFIRWPFVLEGLLLGVIGSVVPILICVFGYDKLIEFVMVNYSIVTTIIRFRSGAEIFPLLIPITVILGGFIGTLGSLSTMRKYLDV